MPDWVEVEIHWRPDIDGTRRPEKVHVLSAKVDEDTDVLVLETALNETRNIPMFNILEWRERHNAD